MQVHQVHPYRLDQLEAVTDLVVTTVMENVDDMEGKPFDGPTVAGEFGTDRAAIVALALAVGTLAREVVALKKELQG